MGQHFIDVITLALTKSQAFSFEQNNPKFKNFSKLKLLTQMNLNLVDDSICTHLLVLGIADFFLANNLVFVSINDSFIFLLENLKFEGDVTLHHLEIATDLKIDFQENLALFQAVILYYQMKFNSIKSILITDLEFSQKSGFSTRKNNVQLVIYNKSLEILKKNYNYLSNQLIRVEFRFFNLEQPFNFRSLERCYFRILHFFGDYKPELFGKIEEKLAINLMNNFKKSRTLYYDKVDERKKYSIKHFLISQSDFVISKRTLRLFYDQLKVDNFVQGNFDAYFHKVLADCTFTLFETQDLENLFYQIISK